METFKGYGDCMLITVFIIMACFGPILSSTTLPSNGGPLCYQCGKQGDPYLCDKTTRCALHQKCFSSYSFYGDPFDSFMWDVGCKSASLCKSTRFDQMTTTSSSRLVSELQRRADPVVSNAGFADDDDRFIVCDECCDGDFCNALPCEHRQTQMKLPKGHVCHSCQNMYDLSQCFDVKQCNPNEICAAWTSANGLLNSDCRDAAQCSTAASNVVSLEKKDISVLDESTSARGDGFSKQYDILSSKPANELDFQSTDETVMHSSTYAEQSLNSFFRLASTDKTCNACCNTSYCTRNLCQSIPKNPVTAKLTPSNVTTSEGGNESFICAVTGTPPLHVSFFFSSDMTDPVIELTYCNQLLNSTSENVTCVLERVSPTNSSLLSCLVTSNSDSTKASAKATVVVKELKRPLTVVRNPPDTVVIGGNNMPATISCAVDGYPAPQYKWYRNVSGSLLDAQSVSYLNVITASDGSYSLLKVGSNYTINSDESFLCQASNKHETVTLPFALKQATNITILKGLLDTDVDAKFNYSFISFQCTFKSYPLANVSWTLTTSSFCLNQSQLLDRHIGARVTADIGASDKTRATGQIEIPTGIFRRQNITSVNCIANNGFFSVDTSARVRNLTSPRILTPSATYTIRRDSDITLRCESVGIPEPSSSWLFSDQFGNPSILPGANILDSGRTLKVSKMSYSGTFVCLSRNSQGTDRVAFKITVV